MIIVIVGVVLFFFFLFLIGILLLIFLPGSPTGFIGSEVKLNEGVVSSETPIILKGDEPSVSYEQLSVILQENLTGVTILTLDGNYDLPSLPSLISFLKYDTTNLLEYVPETVDCDDFARILQGDVLKTIASQHKGEVGNGIAFGTLYGDISLDGVEEPYPHAMNVCITADHRVILIEPQTDQVFVPNSKSTYWAIII